MNDSVIPEKYYQYFGTAFLILVVMAAAYYFTRPVTNNQALGNLARFKNEIHPGWIRMTDDALEQSLRGELPTPWNLEVSRSIMTRWRLGSISEKPIGNLVQDYNRGLWLFPEANVYRDLLAKIDQDWIDRRQQAENNFNLLENTEVKEDDFYILLDYESPIPTDVAGSQIVAIFESNEPVIRQNAPNMYWSLQNIGRKPYMRRLGVVDYLDENKIQVTYDMSWEPVWLAEKSKIAQLSFEFAPQFNFELIELTGADSPLLPVK